MLPKFSLFRGSPYSFLVVLMVNITAFITGASVTWSSPVLMILRSNDTDSLDKSPFDGPISPTDESWIGALSALGAIFGPYFYGVIVQTLGRKISVAVVILPYLIAFLIAAFAKSVALFYVSRVFMGLGVGGMYTVVPIYVVECAEDVNRGLLQASTRTVLMLGFLFSYCVGPYVSIMVFNIVLAVICVIYVPFFWFLTPETPYFLIRKNKEEEAFKSLKYLRRRPDDEVRKELEVLKNHLAQLKPGDFSDLFKTRGTLKAFLYSVIVTTFQQFSGVMVIMAYTENIFDATGGSLSPDICSIIVGSVQFVVSAMAPPLLETLGRKILLLVSVVGGFVGEVILGVYFYMKDDGDDVSAIGWLPVMSLVLFIIFYNIGLASIPWAIMGELLPLNVISKASVIVTSFYWLMGFILTKYFHTMVDTMGMGGTFWLFAGFCLLCAFFTYFFLFETKGKSLAEIQAILNK